jgi:predicted Rossmann-fold nucleotide-binding protein
MYECCPTDVVEIESAARLVDYIEAHGHMRNVVLQGLDLRPHDYAVAVKSVSAEDACFLGCRMAPSTEDHVRESGGTIFPAFTGVPFHPYRGSLYTTEELMEGYRRGEYDSLHDTLDRQIYDYFTARTSSQKATPVMDALAFRIHDHAVDDGLADLLETPPQPRPETVSSNGLALADAEDSGRRRVVGVMGGHRLQRDDPAFRKVAHIGWQLARAGFFVATGGGPGAMEAANLGAYLSRENASTLDSAVDHLADAPHYEDEAYFDLAYDVLDAHPDGAESLAIPTWFYGHEPSNLFPSHVAKYFANSIREDGLLAIASFGVIYAPGSAGTIQEIFMDAAQNHYETFGAASPMIFLDETYWTDTKPVYPLMKTLAEGTPYEGLLSIHDDVDSVTEQMVSHAHERIHS